MRFVAKLTCIVAFLVTVAVAQDAPTFHAQSELVVVSAVVTDHSGAHVPNLKKEDFSVRENGAEQKIAVLEEIHSTPDRLRRVADKPNVYSNFLAGSPGAHRLTIIAIDAINTPVIDQARARSDILKFLNNWINGGEPVALVMLTRSGVKVIHDFAADPKVLAKALARAKNRNEQVVDEPTGEAGPEEDATNAEEQQFLQALADAQQNFTAFQRRIAATITLEDLQSIAQAYSGIPGRKSLVWASSGFPFSISDQTMALNPPGREGVTDILPLYNETWQALNDAQMAVYPVDLRGLVTLSAGASIHKPSRNFNQQMSWANSDRIATFQTIAEATGGRAFYNTNDIAGAFRQAADDSSSYYLIAYYRDAKDTKPGWRKLKVKVDRPGIHIRARSGFFVRKSGADSGNEEQVRRTEVELGLSSPLEFTGIGITASFSPAAPGKKAGTKIVPFRIELGPRSVFVDTDDKNHARVDFFAFARTATGETVAQSGRTIEAHLTAESLAKVEQSGTTFDNSLELPPGEYTVRFVVRDVLSGRMGTVSAPLKVE
jgi:VWFA-related protein